MGTTSMVHKFWVEQSPTIPEQSEKEKDWKKHYFKW